MKIERLRAYMSRDKDRPRVVVAIDTDDGLTGWGECYNHGPDRALLPLLDYLFEFIRGQDPRRIEYLILYLLQQSRCPPGALGLAAISAIDQCLWDISAKALGVPVYMLLGGNVRDKVRVYAGVYTAPDPAIVTIRACLLDAGVRAARLACRRQRKSLHRSEVAEENGRSATILAGVPGRILRMGRSIDERQPVRISRSIRIAVGFRHGD